MQIRGVWESNYRSYGARRVYKALRKESYKVAKCTIERLMRENGIRGVIRGKPHFTTHPDDRASRAADLVNRQFKASRPNELWVSDITYAKTAQGFLYVCFIEDVFSRMIVGWQLSEHLRAEFVTDALEMALWRRDVEPGSLVATRTAVRSTRASPSLSGWPRPALPPRSGRRATRLTTRWPSR